MLSFVEPVISATRLLVFELVDVADPAHPTIIKTLASGIVIMKRFTSQFWMVLGREEDGDTSTVWKFILDPVRLKYSSLWGVVQECHEVFMKHWSDNLAFDVTVSEKELQWSFGVTGLTASIVDTPKSLANFSHVCNCGRPRGKEEPIIDIAKFLTDHARNLFSDDEDDPDEGGVKGPTSRARRPRERALIRMCKSLAHAQICYPGVLDRPPIADLG